MEQNKFPGTFIVIEGADGSGTTTQSKKLADHLDAYWTSEPTDNKVGRKVDEMISSSDYSPEAVALAFAADRILHLEEEVLPRLKKGETVVCDRYYHSSLVYQKVLGAEKSWIESINQEAITPDITFVLDVSAEEGLERRETEGSDGHIFEELDFQQKVVENYRRLEDELDERVEPVDASKSIETVFQQITSYF